MNDRMFGWDLPPGVRLSDIPGNRPEDEKWDFIIDNFWSKDRLTQTNSGTRISEEQYDRMTKLYNSPKLSQLIDDYILAAIEYGMEIGRQEAVSYTHLTLPTILLV